MATRRSAAPAALAATALLLLTGCGPSGDGGPAMPEQRGDTATWTLVDDPLVDPSSTFFVAEVTRLGCAGGETGEVLEPAVVYAQDQVLVRISAAPLPGDAYDCQGNDTVRTEVHLEEPLGLRPLVDAACLDGEAVATSACGDAPVPGRTGPASDGGVRWAPPAGLTRADGVPAWDGPADYRFTTQSSCGEQGFIGEYDVTVRGGDVVAAEVLRRGQELPLTSVPTLTEMLDRARDAPGGNVEVWVDADGVPRWLTLDPDPQILDDESCFLITSYEAPGGHEHAQEVAVDDEDFPVVLGITNQSFDDPDVGLVVTVDGTVRVDRSFAVESQHTVTHFGLDLQPGTHTVTVSSDSGATAETTFVLPHGDRRWVYVTYWFLDPAQEGVSWGGDEQPGPAVEVMVSEEIVPIS